MRILKHTMIILLIVLFLAGCSNKQITPDLDPGLYAQIETNRGFFIIQLEYKKVPMLVMNFIGLAEGLFESAIGENPKDVKFYDGTVFHEAVKDVLIKGGSLPSGQGRREPRYELPNNIHPTLMHDREGAISMFHTGTGVHSHEFTITLKKVPWLDHKEPVFGYVVHGLDRLNMIGKGDVIKTINILRIGDEAAGFTVTMEAFNLLQEDIKKQNQEVAETRTDDVIGTLKKTWPDLIQTREGIWFTILKQGAGVTPQIGTEVSVKYTGTLEDGKIFMDTTSEENGIKKLTVGQIIKGLDGAIQTMRKGEHRIVVIPPELGFGDAGLTPLIPPNAFLIFDVELVDF